MTTSIQCNKRKRKQGTIDKNDYLNLWLIGPPWVSITAPNLFLNWNTDFCTHSSLSTVPHPLHSSLQLLNRWKWFLSPLVGFRFKCVPEMIIHCVKIRRFWRPLVFNDLRVPSQRSACSLRVVTENSRVRKDCFDGWKIVLTFPNGVFCQGMGHVTLLTTVCLFIASYTQ